MIEQQTLKLINQSTIYFQNWRPPHATRQYNTVFKFKSTHNEKNEGRTKEMNKIDEWMIIPPFSTHVNVCKLEQYIPLKAKIARSRNSVKRGKNKNTSGDKIKYTVNGTENLAHCLPLPGVGDLLLKLLLRINCLLETTLSFHHKTPYSSFLQKFGREGNYRPRQIDSDSS